MTRAADARRSFPRGVGDAVFAWLTRLAGLFVLLLLGAIILELFIGGLPAFRQFGIAFLWSANWDPVRQVFGAAAPIYGTIITSVLALILAVPLSFGIAFYLTELAPLWLRAPVGTAIELLAAIPSIIYGMWGFFVIAPLMAQYVQPSLIDSVGQVPVIGDLFQGPPFGTGIFTAALILAVMVIPFIAATMRDVFLTVPAVYKEFGIRPWLHHLGSGALDRSALHAGIRDRWHHAGVGARSRRDDGRHLRHRQHEPDRRKPVRPGQHHRLTRGAGVSGERGRKPRNSPRYWRSASSCS